MIVDKTTVNAARVLAYIDIHGASFKDDLQEGLKAHRDTIRGILAKFVKSGLLQVSEHNKDDLYSITKAGMAYIDTVRRDINPEPIDAKIPTIREGMKCK